MALAYALQVSTIIVISRHDLTASFFVAVFHHEIISISPFRFVYKYIAPQTDTTF